MLGAQQAAGRPGRDLSAHAQHDHGPALPRGTARRPPSSARRSASSATSRCTTAATSACSPASRRLGPTCGPASALARRQRRPGVPSGKGRRLAVLEAGSSAGGDWQRQQPRRNKPAPSGPSSSTTRRLSRHGRQPRPCCMASTSRCRRDDPGFSAASKWDAHDAEPRRRLGRVDRNINSSPRHFPWADHNALLDPRHGGSHPSRSSRCSATSARTRTSAHEPRHPSS